MPAFDLATLAKRQGLRRSVELRPIIPPRTLADELFRAVYRPAVGEWRQALPRIMAEYEQTVAAMTTDAPADIEREIRNAASGIDRLVLILTPALQRWAIRVEKWHRGRWVANVLSAASINLDTMLTVGDVRETVETVIARNVALVRDVSAQAQGRISDAVFRGVQQRKPAREVAKEVREAVAMGRRRSVNIAADQSQKLTSALDRERRRQAGLEKWRWRHSGKAHPRPEHVARDGKVYTDKTAPQERPGDAPYCGCKEQAIIDLD